MCFTRGNVIFRVSPWVVLSCGWMAFCILCWQVWVRYQMWDLTKCVQSAFLKATEVLHLLLQQLRRMQCQGNVTSEHLRSALHLPAYIRGLSHAGSIMGWRQKSKCVQIWICQIANLIKLLLLFAFSCVPLARKRKECKSDRSAEIFLLLLLRLRFGFRLPFEVLNGSIIWNH